MVKELKRAQISVWYDKDIRAGSKWKAEIDNALKHAFAVAVIVTDESVKSQYVTYEWSWAIGYGLNVFPLKFENKDFELHPRLNDHQIVDCSQGMPELLIEEIKRNENASTDIQYLNSTIYHILERVQITFEIAFWAFFKTSENEINENVKFLITYAFDQANKIEKRLRRLMLDYSDTLPIRLRRICQDIIDCTAEFCRAWMVINMVTDPKQRYYHFAACYYDTWLTPIQKIYPINDDLRKWVTEYFSPSDSQTPAQTLDILQIAMEIVDVVEKTRGISHNDQIKTSIRANFEKSLVYDVIKRSYKKKTQKVWDYINSIEDSKNRTE